jgi:palmitoyl-protein thioesterase
MKFCFVGLIVAPLLALCKLPRSLVVWHGLGELGLLIGLELELTDFTGDSYNSTGMLEFQELVKQVHPGIFVYSVYIDKDLENDRRAGFVSYFRNSLLADI